MRIDASEGVTEDHSRYRAVAARSDHSGVFPLDLQFAVQEVCRGMVAPDWRRVKRIARCLHMVPRAVISIGAESENEDAISAYEDSGWADCRRSRRSTSGGVLTIGAVALKARSSTQSTIATSSGEAE